MMLEERNKSPDIPPTMVPRTSSIGATPSPFASLLPQPPPVSPPALKLPSSEASAVAAQQSLASLSPLYAAGFPPTFPLMSTPGFHNLPFHKQALLSPLLAHTHLWHMARSAANPLLNAQRPAELDLMAEHKALMERFAAAAMAAQAQAAASAASAASSKEDRPKSASPPPPASSPKNINNNNNAEPQNAPMDLSNKRSSDEEDSEEDSELKPPLKKKHVRSDLNRNVVMHHQGPSGSEADDEEVDQEDEEELDVGENLIR